MQPVHGYCQTTQGMSSPTGRKRSVLQLWLVVCLDLAHPWAASAGGSEHPVPVHERVVFYRVHIKVLTELC